MAGRTVPSNGGPSELERSLVRLGRRALGVCYVGVALLGFLHLDLRSALVVVPFLSVVVTGLRWSIHQALHAEATPSSALLLPAATVGALFAPFGMGIQQLGEAGSYLFLGMTVLMTVLGLHWLHRVEVPTGQAAVDDRPPPPPRSTEPAPPPPRELLQRLTLDDLVGEWHRSDELLRRTPPGDRRTTVEWRGALLDELERRDPRGFGDWVLDGSVRGPEHHIRAGSDRAPTGPDDPAR